MTIGELTLRTFRPDDVPSLIEIDREFQREAGFGTPEQPFFENRDYHEVPNLYLNAGGAFWVIESAEGEVVAFGGVLRVDERTARLRRFRVRQDWRRRGLASLLVEEAERFCRERGYQRVTLGTAEDNLAAQALYRKHGYGAAGDHLLRPGLREVEFKKRLA